MSITEIQNEIVEEFELFDDWEDKYAHLIELGKKLAPLPELYKTDALKVKGCQSSVWLYAEVLQGRVVYTADSDALIVKGLVSLLIKLFNHQTPKDIATENIFVLEKIGMQQHLSMTRANGLDAMLKQMKAYAVSLAQ